MGQTLYQSGLKSTINKGLVHEASLEIIYTIGRSTSVVEQ